MPLAVVNTKHCSEKYPNISFKIIFKYALSLVHSWYLHRITNIFIILGLPLLMWQVADEFMSLVVFKHQRRDWYSRLYKERNRHVTGGWSMGDGAAILTHWG